MIRRAALVAAFVLAGCSTFQNTPAQDRTWAAYEVCKHQVPTNITIQRVEPDGRYWWQTREGSFGQTQLADCMREQFAKSR